MVRYLTTKIFLQHFFNEVAAGCFKGWEIVWNESKVILEEFDV